MGRITRQSQHGRTNAERAGEGGPVRGLRGGASGKGRTGAERASRDPCAPGTAAASGAGRGGCAPYPRLRLTGGGRGCFVTSHSGSSSSSW